MFGSMISEEKEDLNGKIYEQALFNPNCTCICMVPLLFLFGSEI
jgi:hypothetical protein